MGNVITKDETTRTVQVTKKPTVVNVTSRQQVVTVHPGVSVDVNISHEQTRSVYYGDRRIFDREKDVGTNPSYEIERVSFGLHSRAARRRWLHHAGVPTNLTGAIVRRDGRITAAALTASTIFSGVATVYLDGIARASISVNGATGAMTAPNINVEAGQMLAVFLDSNDGVDFPVADIWIASGAND